MKKVHRRHRDKLERRLRTWIRRKQSKRAKSHTSEQELSALNKSIDAANTAYESTTGYFVLDLSALANWDVSQNCNLANMFANIKLAR